MVIFIFMIKYFPHVGNHVGRESNVPLAASLHIWKRDLSSRVAMHKLSDAAGVMSDCFFSQSVKRGGWIPAQIGRGRDRSSTMSVSGGVGCIRAFWRDGHNLDN